MSRIFLILLLSSVALISSAATQSTCYGSTSQGRLENGVQLPYSGKNFISYSRLAGIAGRTYVHSMVRTVILDSYRRLQQRQPGKVFKYAETGFRYGGGFKPHRTHQNGLSVDFMVPVVDGKGQSVYLPTNLANRLGYDIEFDQHGRYQHLRIDYPAMAAHLRALDASARRHGIRLRRVIFDPVLQQQLFSAPGGADLQRKLTFMKKPAWVRHDEHYHVDFRVQCKPLLGG